MAKKILAINPGSTSTKIAVYDGMEVLYEITLRHSAEELAPYDNIIDQFGFRKEIIVKAIAEAGIDIKSLDGIIGRGGLLKPIPSGTYEVNDAMRRDLMSGQYGQHASNLGALIAYEIATEIGGRPAFIADPVVVDELQDVARVTGRPEIERISIFHALNQKAIARAYAEQKGVAYESLNLIVAHLGGGISVGAHKQGKVIDVNNALNGDGPFSPERSGTLPAWQLAQMCFSGKYTQDQMRKMITGNGGIVALLGTNNMLDIENRAAAGEKEVVLIHSAMAYMIGKSIGAMSVVLHGKVDAVILTGGIAYDKILCGHVKEMVGHIGEFVVMPGENELEALVSNAIRVLEGSEKPKVYA